MRFSKGSKVEVLTQKEVPSGSWRCAEIIDGDGHSYTVCYDDNMSVFGKETNERVLRKAIRPCPPTVDVLEDWVTGDVLEVFHNFSWKMATVLKVFGRIHLLVRLLGSVIELEASRHDVRPRLCWKDGEWILIGKDGFQSFCAKPQKRKRSHIYSQLEADQRHNQKTRVGKKECVPHPINARQQPQLLPEKVDNVACSQVLHGEKSIQPFFINKTNRCHEIISEKVKKVCLISNDNDDDDDIVSSSVGSCSLHRNHPHELHYVYRAGPLEDNECHRSDAESICQLRPQEIRRLELHAYRSIIEALHASGPLSWEHELLLTNLRDSLHISNDEHLMEIRNLVSSSSCTPC